MARKPPAPSNLSARAKRVWTKTLEKYLLREDELSLLTEYCKEMTLVDELEEARATAPLMVKASHGGDQINPIYSELRMHRTTLLSLWKGLKLPDSEDESEETNDDDGKVTPMSREEVARKAANTRWGKKNG